MTRWGLLACTLGIAALYWPTDGRRIESQLSSLARAASHDGPSLQSDWLQRLDGVVRTNFSTSTSITLEGVANQTVSRDQIIQALVEVAGESTRLQLELEQLQVNFSQDHQGAQVTADAVIERSTTDRTDRERRHVSIALRREAGMYRIIGVEGSAKIVNQPEPRP